MIEIIKNVEIENIVSLRIKEYEERKGRINSYKIPIEDIIIDAGLSLEYEEINENPGEKFLAGLDVETRAVIINSKHSQLFSDKPGLERSTMAHELGHWDIFEKNKANSGNITLDFYNNSSELLYRQACSGRKCIIVDIWHDDDVYQVVKRFDQKKDHPYVASAVDRYANYLLLPKEKVLDYIKNMDLTVWKNLYKMAENFEVTISSVCVRLQRMGLIFIKDKIIYESKDKAIGQEILF